VPPVFPAASSLADSSLSVGETTDVPGVAQAGTVKVPTTEINNNRIECFVFMPKEYRPGNKLAINRVLNKNNFLLYFAYPVAVIKTVKYTGFYAGKGLSY
jgi:hypothetical protein